MESRKGSAPLEARRVLLSRVAIVLVRTSYAENIGAAARVAANMGISRLILVRDEMPDEQRMRKMATHHAAHLIDSLQLFPRLEEALAPFQWVVGSSARQGRQRHTISGPKRAMADLAGKAAGNEAALVFGPEDRGLSNDDLALCNVVTTIPTADFASLNLAQAVALLSYELYCAVLADEHHSPPQPAGKLACNRELRHLSAMVEETLRAIGHLKESDYGHWMRNLRQFLGRVELRSREVKFLVGFCRQVIALTVKKTD